MPSGLKQQWIITSHNSVGELWVLLVTLSGLTRVAAVTQKFSRQSRAGWAPLSMAFVPTGLRVAWE